MTIAIDKRRFTQTPLLDFLDLLTAHGIEVWLDGGWAVDALLGVETRPHADVDIVVREADVAPLRALLEARGYVDVPRDDTRPHNFVMGNAHGEEVDVHAVVIDAAGNGLYGAGEGIFPAAGFGGIGQIGGRTVQCLTPEQLVAFHSTYTPDADDVRDVAALCARFGVPYPASYPTPEVEGLNK